MLPSPPHDHPIQWASYKQEYPKEGTAQMGKSEGNGQNEQAEFDSDGARAAHEAVQESYEAGAADATLDVSDESFEEEADHGISRMMGEGGVAPPETPKKWQEWVKRKQPHEGDQGGKM